MQIEFYGNTTTKKLAEAQSRGNPEVLRQYCLKAKETDYTNRMMNVLNKEMSPFQDEVHKDSQFAKEMLDKYRIAEEFDIVTTPKQVRRETHKVHSYLKVMEQGENHKDAKLLKEVSEGTVGPTDLEVRKYLTKRYHVVKGRFTSATF